MFLADLPVVPVCVSLCVCLCVCVCARVCPCFFRFSLLKKNNCLSLIPENKFLLLAFNLSICGTSSDTQTHTRCDWSS